MTKQTKLMTGLLAGAALGTIAVLVITANKNGKLKEKVSNWLCDLIDSSKDKFAKTLSKTQQEATKMHS